MTRPTDPQSTREYNARYYQEHKHLKGKHPAPKIEPKKAPAKAPVKSSPKATPKPKSHNLDQIHKAKARIGRLRSKLSKLRNALAEVEAELSSKRQNKEKTDKANSDGKTTAKERQDSKGYRDKHKQELANKRNDKSSSSKSGSSSSKSVSDMDRTELENRASKIRGAIKEAQRQLNNATQQLGQLAHSAILSHSNIDERYAHFQSAERIPSK